MPLFVTGDVIACPRCGERQDDRVEDYVVPGLVGEDSACQDECWDCGASFTVTCVAPGRYEVLSEGA